MNKKQWYIFAIIFFLLATVLANFTASTSSFEIGSIQWLSGRQYAIAAWFSFALAFAFGVAGFFEKEEGKRK